MKEPPPRRVRRRLWMNRSHGAATGVQCNVLTCVSFQPIILLIINPQGNTSEQTEWSRWRSQSDSVQVSSEREGWSSSIHLIHHGNHQTSTELKQSAARVHHPQFDTSKETNSYLHSYKNVSVFTLKEQGSILNLLWNNINPTQTDVQIFLQLFQSVNHLS